MYYMVVVGTSDNPSVSQFDENTQALRIVDSFCRGPVRGNCRGARRVTIDEASCAPFQREGGSNPLSRES